ncbi:MAG TPA: hypothetical protein VK468_07520 [Pyrinomonadaceae bacterium]|nr:hypothetical protein [Pyrinomonadaceae bacterium]
MKLLRNPAVVSTSFVLMEKSTRKAGIKSQSTPSAESFQRFLAFLDNGGPSDGLSYLDIRRRLSDYFDRKNCASPDELADETLSRVARRLEEEGSIDSEAPAKYCYTVARYVFLESLRSPLSRTEPVEDRLPRRGLVAVPSLEDVEEQTRKERMLDCLDRCTAELDTANRDLIIRFYYGAERVKIDNRRRLAADLGVTPNALNIRAFRIREKLHDCVRKCFDRK